jgi:hypothetical protein
MPLRLAEMMVSMEAMEYGKKPKAGGWQRVL